MRQLSWQSGRFRRATGLAIALLALGLLPGVTTADSPLPASSRFKPDLTWIAALVARPSAPPSVPEPPPLFRFAEAPDQPRLQESPSPGLQVYLDPDEDEVFLGWQFEF